MGRSEAKIDEFDKRILEELQRDAARSVEQVAKAVGLSQNPCWRRIKRLEADGVIEGRVAVVDPARVGAGETVFVSIRTRHHDDAWRAGFAEGVAAIPEVVECYRMSGDVDYLLKILVRDIADYDRIYRRLIRVAQLDDVSSSFAMERLKSTTEVPISGTW